MTDRLLLSLLHHVMQGWALLADQGRTQPPSRMRPEHCSSFLGEQSFPTLLLEKPLEPQVLLMTGQQYHLMSTKTALFHWLHVMCGLGEELRKKDSVIHKTSIAKCGIRWSLDCIAPAPLRCSFLLESSCVTFRTSGAVMWCKLENSGQTTSQGESFNRPSEEAEE